MKLIRSPQRRLVVQTCWLLLAVLMVLLFGTIVPSSYLHLQDVCTQSSCSQPHLTPESTQTLHALGLPRATFALYFLALDSLLVVLFSCLSALIIWRRPSDPAAVLGSFFLLTFLSPILLSGAGTVESVPALLRWSVPLLNFTGIGVILPFFYVFPDGRFVPRWTALLATAWLLWITPQYLAARSVIDPTTWPTAIQVVGWLGFFVTVIGAQVYRYRRVSRLLERQQMKWVVYAIGLTLGCFLAIIVFAVAMPATNDALTRSLAGVIVSNTLFYLLWTPVPSAIATAILRYRLWDIDVVINRTLVYGSLTTVIVAVYAGIVGGVGGLLQAEGNVTLALLGAVAVAIVVQPARSWLQRAVNRLMYGDRSEPYAVLARLGQQLEGRLSQDAVLPTVVEAIGTALKLPYVAVVLRHGPEFRVAASYGATTAAHTSLPLLFRGEMVGQLHASPRTGESAFSPADERLLHDLARQIGAAARATLLTEELQRSRERLVTAREEERRRLRRELHDDLGPTLSAVSLKAGGIRGALKRDPTVVDDLVVDLMGDLQTSVKNIRQLAYELRPPALDEMGLVGAIKALASHWEEGDENGRPRLDVVAPDSIGPLPAAHEVAAYRIAAEAFTNVLRHARARTCTIRITIDSALTLEVVDDGVGLSPGGRAGVGVVSMRERAEELGGTLIIESERGHGTTVRAQLPLRKDS